MSFLTKLDILYLEQKRDLKDSEIDYNFKCFIPIQPIGYSSKNKFFVKKSRKASLIINVGEQRIYFSDIDVVNTILDLPLEVRSDILKKFIEMYSANKAVNTKIRIGTKQYDGFGLPYYDGENSIDVFSDSKIDLNDFIFIVNFILSKDKKSEEQGQKKTIRTTLRKFISLIDYYGDHNDRSSEYLKAIGYPLDSPVPFQNSYIKKLFETEDGFDISKYL